MKLKRNKILGFTLTNLTGIPHHRVVLSVCELSESCVPPLIAARWMGP